MSSKTIGIVGLGLIGGSLGLDLQRLGYEVYGLVHRKETVRKAKERGLAEFISTNPNILTNCSMIILALPLSQLINPEPKLISALPVNAVITDVGSVKKPVLDTWRTLHPRFVGSHPMAGTIEHGVEAGRPELFKNNPWIITIENSTDPEAIKDVEKIVHALGSKSISTDPETHDQAVALISHLPVFISAALIKTVNSEKDETLVNLAKTIASSGFKDTSRVGGGHPDLGVAMATNNAASILKSLKSYRASIDQLEEMITKQQWGKLKKELKDTQQKRPDFT